MKNVARNQPSSSTYGLDNFLEVLLYHHIELQLKALEIVGNEEIHLIFDSVNFKFLILWSARFEPL